MFASFIQIVYKNVIIFIYLKISKLILSIAAELSTLATIVVAEFSDSPLYIGLASAIIACVDGALLSTSFFRFFSVLSRTESN